MVKSLQYELEHATTEPQVTSPHHDSPLFVRCTQRLFQSFSQFVLKFYCPMQVDGREYLPTSPFLLCSNHNSHMDSPVLMTASRLPFSSFGMLAARDYFFENRTRRVGSQMIMNLIPIERNANRKSILQSVASCQSFIRAGGRGLIIYPEGTRSTTGVLRGKFKKGPAIIAVELGLPIVPVYVSGTSAAWGKGKRFMRPRPIRVTFGAPIMPDEFASDGFGQDGGGDVSRFEAYRAMTEELEKRVRALKPSGD